jgi:hypothetical protein
VVGVPGYRSRGPRSFPALPDFLRSSGSGMGSTQPHEIIEELLGKKNSDFGQENRDYGRRDPLRATPLYPQKLALTSPTSGGRGIVRSRTNATELVSYVFTLCCMLEKRETKKTCTGTRTNESIIPFYSYLFKCNTLINSSPHLPSHQSTGACVDIGHTTCLSDSNNLY